MDEPVPPSCKAILREYRAAPKDDFGPGYEGLRAMFRDIAAAKRSGRLDALTADRMVDGAVIRATRREPEFEILAWIGEYAGRRGYTWRGTR